MKKLALILAIAMIAAFAAPATASEFTAAGQARYEAVAVDFDDWGPDSEYFDQRYRVAFTWKVNDNVTTQLRGDFAETQWGSGYRPGAGSSTIMIDRAWVKINQGPLTLTVGQQGGQLGHGMIWSDQFQGIMANLDFSPFQVNLLYVKESEGGALSDEDSLGTEDTNIFGVQLVYASDAFTGGLTYAYGDKVPYNLASNFTPSQQVIFGDDLPLEGDELSAYGAHFTAPIGDITLKGALAFFDGETEVGLDITGTQAFVTADMAFSDAFKAGLTVLWADSADYDEAQATSVQDDGVFNILDFGGAMCFNNVLGYVHYGNDIFDVDGFGGGALGVVGTAQWAATDTLTFWAKLGLVEPDESSSPLDDALYAVGNFDWVWVPSVTVSAGAAYASYDWAWGDEDILLTTVQLTVAF